MRGFLLQVPESDFPKLFVAFLKRFKTSKA